MRFKRLQGVFEIAAEGGEQPVAGGSRQAVDGGALRKANTRLKAGGCVEADKALAKKPAPGARDKPPPSISGGAGPPFTIPVVIA